MNLHAEAQRLIEKAADGRLNRSEAAQLSRHVQDCADCQAYRERTVQFGAQLGRVMAARWPLRSIPRPELAALSARLEGRRRRDRVAGQVGQALQALAWTAAIVLVLIVILPGFYTLATQGTPATATASAEAPTSTPPATGRPAMIEVTAIATIQPDPLLGTPVDTTSLAEAQAQVPFTLTLPTWLPAGFIRRDEVGLASDRSWVMLQWDHPSNKAITLLISRDDTPYPAAPGSTEFVTVNGQTAALITGGWDFETGAWDLARQVTLKWQPADLYYLLSARGSVPADDLMRMAGSILPPAQTPTPVPTNTPVPTPVPLGAAAVADCPVSQPNLTESPDPYYISTDGGYGNPERTMFIGLYPNGAVLFHPDGPGSVAADSHLGMKFWFYRTVPGEVVIEGRRLDEPGPTALLDTLRGPADGYGETGFNPAGLEFPSQGCWEVTASIDEARMTFVTLVVWLPFTPLRTSGIPEGHVDHDLDLSGYPERYQSITHFEGGGMLEVGTALSSWDEPVPYPESAQQRLTIRGQPAICVRGAWDGQQWNVEADAGVLMWSDGELSYRISHMGLGLRCVDLYLMAH